MSAPNSQRTKLADSLEKQLGDDELPSMWGIPAQDMRLIIEALREERSGPDGVVVPENRITPEMLNAPCLWCGYNGREYWQSGSHSKDCRWHGIGGACERFASLSSATDGS